MASDLDEPVGSRNPGRFIALQSVAVAILLATFPALHIALRNPGQVSPTGVAVVVGCSVAAAIVLMALLRLARSEWSSSLIFVAGLLLLTFGYGPVHAWLEYRATSVAADVEPELPFLLRILYDNLLAFWAVCVGIWSLAVGRLGTVRSANIAAVLPAIAALLYVSLFAQAGVRAFSQSNDRTVELIRDRSAASNWSGIGDDPDIYYIVLDGYARADVLRKYYADDNAQFLQALRRRGFMVAGNSSANYYWTFLSLASSLNFQYLDSLIGHPTEAQLRGRRPFYRAIRDNEAARFLRGRGYRYIHFQSTWGATLSNEFADQQIGCEKTFFRDDFARAVVELTPLRLLGSRVAIDLADCYRSHFTALANLGNVRGPKFVFAHFLPPHHPYLFDRQGRTLRSATISDQFEFQKRLWERRDQYLDQLMYVNTRVLESVDAIMAASERPPIILIQSDHGPNLQDGLSTIDQQALRFANLSAALLPGAPRGLLPDSDSAVNKIPRVFNYYFGTDFPIRPNRHFYSSYSAPFDLKPVAPDGSIATLR